MGLLDLYGEVERKAGDLERVHAGRLQCRRGCSDCCVDGLTVFRIEAERIRQRHESLLRTGTPHPAGRCAFLDADGACRIYEDRPYVCRTQGLPLRWTEERPEGPVELRDICPLNEVEAEPLESIPADDCWTIGPWEGRLATLQQKMDPSMERIALRDLFVAIK